jgi:hypothetical protein
LNVGFTGFNGFALATKRRKVACTHCLTQAVHQEAPRFVADVEHTLNLMGADALLHGDLRWSGISSLT